VIDVKPELQLGGDPAAAPVAPLERATPAAPDDAEIDSSPNLLALGAALGWSIPTPSGLNSRVAVSPLIKLGSPSGLGPSFAFDWFHANLESIGVQGRLAQVHVKPIMAGIGYTMAANRFSVAPSIVAGYAFNSLTLSRTGVRAEGLPVEVGNSFVWRIGASTWVDVGRRVALNVSTGYLFTGLRFTVVEGGRLQRRHESGDTTVLHIGVAYKLF
jgi:hypothetical protein